MSARQPAVSGEPSLPYRAHIIINRYIFFWHDKETLLEFGRPGRSVVREQGRHGYRPDAVAAGHSLAADGRGVARDG